MLNLAKDGFEHLNSFVGQISSDRKHNKERFADIEELRRVILQLEWIGNYPEIWKLASETFSPQWRKNKDAAIEVLDKGTRYLSIAQISEADTARIRTQIASNKAQLLQSL